jgi:hypothetical protein
MQDKKDDYKQVYLTIRLIGTFLVLDWIPTYFE